jgi:glyoxylate/hydroxypyruvate reductase
MSVGYEHIDLDACRERDIRVCNTPNVSTDSVAELTVALLLLTARRLLEGNSGLLAMSDY